ncbi:hypothetical protein PENSPDRAFT_416085 [Peniophora sp. CONT]|nr:hypothetical protein PENSPDRAFT_416085 [Peniophora sp. CONT]
MSTATDHVHVTNLPRALIRGSPAAVAHLKSLFLATRGSVLRPGDELVKAIASLSTSLCVPELGLSEGRLYTGTLKIGGDLWQAIISSELLFLLLEIVKDDSFVIQPQAWISDVLTCVAGFLSVWLAHVLQTENRVPALPVGLAQRVITELDSASKPVWSRMAVFLNEKRGVPNAPYRILEMLASICIDGGMLQSFLHTEDKTALSRNEFIPISFCAWTRATSGGVDSNIKLRQTPVLLKDYWRDHVLGGGTLSASEMKAPKLDIAVALVGTSPVVEAFCAQMASPMVLDGFLCDILLIGGVITSSVLAQNAALREAFWESPISRRLSEALQRQVQNRGIFGGDGHTFVRICKLAGDLIDWVGMCVDCGKCSATQGRDCLDVIMRLSIMAVHGLRFVGNEDRELSSLLEKNATTLLSVVGKWTFFIGEHSSVHGRGDDFRRVQTQMRTAARDVWYPTILRLRALSEILGKRTDYNNIVGCWSLFGNALGLQEDVERARYSQQGSRLCSWTTCRYYCTPAPNALSTCKGCQEARYCSRECQRSDWKQGGHRIVCRRVKS